MIIDAIRDAVATAVQPWRDLESEVYLRHEQNGPFNRLEPVQRLKQLIHEMERRPADQMRTLARGLTKFAPEEMDTIRTRHGESRRALDDFVAALNKADEIPF